MAEPKKTATDSVLPRFISGMVPENLWLQFRQALLGLDMTVNHGLEEAIREWLSRR